MLGFDDGHVLEHKLALPYWHCFNDCIVYSTVFSKMGTVVPDIVTNIAFRTTLQSRSDDIRHVLQPLYVGMVVRMSEYQLTVSLPLQQF